MRSRKHPGTFRWPSELHSMLTFAIFAGLLASFFGGVIMLLAATRVRPQDEIWWPLLLGTGTRTLPRDDRLAIIGRLADISDSWRDPILRCAREQESDPEIKAEVTRAMEREL